MLLLISGASGAGKSTARTLVAPALEPSVECVELAQLRPLPETVTIDWRQQATETAVQRAVALQSAGRHLLLAGDPVAAGEVVAAPSAPYLDGIAVCLLDLTPEAQARRLGERGDPPALLPHHQAFGAWMRGHAASPLHLSHVLSEHGWPQMRWERLASQAADWHTHVIDTTDLTREQTARAVLEWVRGILDGRLRAFTVDPGQTEQA